MARADRYRRQLHTRWDESLLTGVVDYLATADRAVRALVRWRQAVGVPSADPDDLATEAVAAFEELRERSQVISLLTGDREDPVRRASREMREPLLPLRDEVLGGDGLDDAEVQSLINEHRDARTELLRACQTRPGVTGDATGTSG